VNPNLLAVALPAICSKISLEEFQARSGMLSRTTARFVLTHLMSHGIGQLIERYFVFSNADKMKLAILALQHGNDLEEISKSINWKDFEALTSELLSLSGYATVSNLYFSKPSRIEIDVVGVSENCRLAVIVDCKHWKQNNFRAISGYARKQVYRASILLLHKRMRHISNVVPIILTLYPMSIKFVDGVPIVPIIKFKSFIEDLQLYLSVIRVICR
jgi:hypothetical protein